MVLCFTRVARVGSTYAPFSAALGAWCVYATRSASGTRTLLTTGGFFAVRGSAVYPRKRSSSFTVARIAVVGLRFLSVSGYGSKRDLPVGVKKRSPLDDEFSWSSSCPRGGACNGVTLGAHAYSSWHAV